MFSSLVKSSCKLCGTSLSSVVIRRSLLNETTAFRNFQPQRFYSLYEPPYINDKSAAPSYDTLWLTLKGHEFSSLESYSSYAQELLRKQMNLTVSDFWPMPTVNLELDTFKSSFETVKPEVAETVKLPLYQRVIQLDKVPNNLLPIIMEVMQQQLPEGVDLVVSEPDNEVFESRFVPDKAMEDLQDELEIFRAAREAKRRKAMA